MKVWENLAELTDKVSCREWIKFGNTTGCPATIEGEFDLIGEEKMNKFCNLGCSVICLDEYLDLKV